VNVKNLAKKLPFPVKQTVKYIYGAIPEKIRYGKVFWDTYNFLHKSQWWDRKKLEEYQMQQVRKLLKHTYENVPYYQKLFGERGLTPEDIQNFEDLKKLPFITKEEMRDNLNDLVAQNFPKSALVYITTGGSTGIPFGFFEQRNFAVQKERAFILTMWERVGFSIGEKTAVFRGSYIGDATKEKFWKYDPISKELSFSSYHMTDEYLMMYLKSLEKFKPKYIQAYPSVISILARFILENDITGLFPIKAILAASENLYPSQRELIEKAFKCRVFSFYGHAEKAALAGECEHSTFYHISPEYGYLELIGRDGTRVTKDSDIGEIVVTGFNNYATPFIRYKTMDLGIWSNKECRCGRQYQLLERIEGRLQEFIVTGTGRLISMTAINMHSDVFDNVKQFQFYQDTPGKVIFKVVKKKTYSDRDNTKISNELLKKLGEDMELKIVFVDEIPRTARGKLRFLEQKLNIRYGE